MFSCLSRCFSSFLLVLFTAVSAHAVEMRPVTPEKAYAPLSPEALQELVGPIALYPDDLVAIVLPASTFPLQVVQAARFREQDPDGKPSDRWDGSVVALLNYPEVLKKLNNDLDWTWRLGEAVINQQPDVLKAVSAFRERARVAGNLKSDDRQIVEVREKVVYIRPVRERVIYVPYYDPWEVTRYGARRVYHYYPDPCPVYYYPYDDYWDFPSRHFWGVSTWYGIGWHDNRVHWLHHSYRHHPYYGRTYRDHGRWRRYRHQDAPAYVDQPATPVVAGEVPMLPEGSIWQPGQQAGSRPFGDRRDYPGNAVGPVGGPVPGGGGESAVSIPPEVPAPAASGETVSIPSPSMPSPADPIPAGVPVVEPASAATPTADAPVVYEGNVNGERVRIIRRGSTFERETVDSAAMVDSAPEPVIHAAPEPAIHAAPAPSVQDGTPYGGQHQAEIQAAIERAREQAREQSAIYERQPLEAERSEAERFRSERFSSEGFSSERSRGTDGPTYERPVQSPAAEPAFEPRREVIEQPSIHESRGGWGNDAAIEEAISRARDQGLGREQSPRHEPSSGSSWGSEAPAESRDWRREERFEAPSRGWGGDGSRFEPAREERSEPAWQPQEQQQIQIDDVRMEGQQ